MCSQRDGIQGMARARGKTCTVQALSQGARTQTCVYNAQGFLNPAPLPWDTTYTVHLLGRIESYLPPLVGEGENRMAYTLAEGIQTRKN